MSKGVWEAAKRGEGYQLAFGSNITWFFIIVGGIFKFIFRFFTGRPLLGDERRRTNATWSTPGTFVYNDKRPTTRPPGSWHWLPERARAGIRVGLLITLTTAVWSLLAGSIATGWVHTAFSTVTLFFLWWALYRITDAMKLKATNRKQTRDLVQPLKSAVAQILGMEPRNVKVTIPAQVTKGERVG